MKYSNITAFEKHLESAAPNHFADIYLILAKEGFARKQAVHRLSSLLLKGEASPQLCTCTFDAEKHSVDEVLQEVEMIAFFTKKRLIVLQNGEALDKAATVKIEKYLAAPNRSICFVVTASSLNRATTFYKKLEKSGIVLDIADEKPWEREKGIADWLQREAAKEGKQISPQVCQLLVKQLGTDQSLIHAELQKLICYTGERPEITKSDIAAISVALNLDTAWQLGEAIFRRNVTEALRISKGLLMEGIALIALFRQLRSQFQTEFQVCSILAQGGSPADVSKEFPYMKGTILDRHIRQSQAYGMQHFKAGLLAIDAAELQAKNSAADPDFLTERLIITLTI